MSKLHCKKMIVKFFVMHISNVMLDSALGKGKEGDFATSSSNNANENVQCMKMILLK